MTTDVPGATPEIDRKESASRTGIAAGVMDAAMSSLATFVAALVAANLLTNTELGVYAVFFTAFNFGQVVANNLVYIPAEVAAVDWPKPARLRIVEQSIRLALVPSLAGAAAIGFASIVAAQIAPSSLVLPLTITAAATTFLWPTQDHIRRVLHIADRSWAAAGVSAAHLSSTVGSIGALHWAGVDAAWLPFGSLAIANMVSLAIGLVLVSRAHSESPLPRKLQLGELTRSGAWLLTGVGIPTVAAFGAATIITFAAGAEALGYAEQARIAAHPILVAGTGIGYVLGPSLMRGAIAGDRAVSRHYHYRFAGLIGLATIGYVAVAGWEWAGNPMLYLVPDAFELNWLVLATIGANVLMVLLVLPIQELMAAGRARTIGMVSLLSAPLQLAAAATAGATGAFARPLSLAVASGARLAGNARAIVHSYRHWHSETAGVVPPGGDKRPQEMAIRTDTD